MDGMGDYRILELREQLYQYSSQKSNRQRRKRDNESIDLAVVYSNLGSHGKGILSHQLRVGQTWCFCVLDRPEKNACCFVSSADVLGSGLCLVIPNVGFRLARLKAQKIRLSFA